MTLTLFTEAGFRTDGHVDVAVIVVAFNSADDVVDLLHDLRREASRLAMRVIVADNASRDGIFARLQEHPDVVSLPTGGNLGYAGAINRAMREVGEAEAVLVLNPDLRLDPHAIERMLARLRSTPEIGAVVPLLRDADGSLAESLRREPGVVRAAADALLGPHWSSRPAALSEYVRDPRAYAWAHPVEWATGAALMISARVARSVGAWDERFFLYSEETDLQRRIRQAGWEIWFEPAAAATHRQGGSGASDELVALTVVNRIRYMDKHAPGRAELFRAVVRAGELLRRRDPSHARARWALARRRRWEQLPRAQHDEAAEHYPPASIVIPAHDEAAVIERTLAPLARLAAVWEVIVVCNGCTDDTAARARRVPGVRVLETPTASKTAALNLGDGLASGWPRIYLDADIRATPDALASLIRGLEAAGTLAGRPASRTDATGSSPLVRAYHRARERMPSTSASLWGAGAYALTRAGHDRLGAFPEVTADDVYVDRLFAAHEKVFPAGEPVVVTAPRTAAALLAVLRRARRGPAELGVDTGSTSARELLSSVRGPATFSDALVYAGFALAARSRTRGRTPRWERDDTTRRAERTGVWTQTRVDHVLLTRFNLPTPGPESLVRAREGWLRERVDLFERYTVPSMRAQTVRDFTWLVYLDSDSPAWLIDRLAPYVQEGLFVPLLRERVEWQDVAADARGNTGAEGDVLLTTNLDNDDAIAVDFVERLQLLARRNPSAALFLGRGLIVRGDRVYRRRDDENAFCSVAESWHEPVTAWRDWHTLLGRYRPVVVEHGAPGWLQVVHDRNVSNRVRGVRVSPGRHRSRFAGALDGLPAPTTGAVLVDRVMVAPWRLVRESSRGIAKALVLRAAGKDGLDRLKHRLRARSAAQPLR